MNTSLRDYIGKEIKSFSVRGGRGYNHFFLPDKEQKCIIEEDYLGDSSLLWIVIYRNGVIEKRYNMNDIVYINHS